MNKNIFKLGLVTVLSASMFMACQKDDDNNNNNNQGTNKTELYVSNNSNGNVTIYDMETEETKTLSTTSTAAEGIYYDADNDNVIQASRSSNQLNVYANISTLGTNTLLAIAFSSASDLDSPRDIAVNGNMVVVADNADADGDPLTDDGRLFIYTKNNGSLTLRNTVSTDFAVWGIEFVGNDLYAVVDKTNQLAVFANFTASNTTNSTVSATKTIAIEGIVRTHGLAYDGGTMILTDVGDAASDTDGAFHIIADFDSKFSATQDGDMMAIAGNQVRVAGAATMMGNPVAAEYDADANIVYIAEAANGGGRVMSYNNADVGGDLSPSTNKSVAKASSLYLHEK